jgi:hypothetical protein
LKGEEGKGVFCTFAFLTRNWDPKQKAEYDQERARESKKADVNRDLLAMQLAEKYGVYEVSSKEVVDYHTQVIDMPTALIKNALTVKPDAPKPTGSELPALQVQVKCESGGQYLGVAKYDFYILNSEGSFAWNFFKGAAGLWMRLCIVIGIAVACSTYLSGVISGLVVLFFFSAGMMQDFVQKLAENKSVGGGPLESLVRLVERQNLVTPLEQTPGTAIVLGTDEVYRFYLKLIMNIFPDIDRFDWTQYVAEGFNIGIMSTIVLNLLVLLGYLLPWAVLSYYLIKSREIASA